MGADGCNECACDRDLPDFGVICTLVSCDGGSSRCQTRSDCGGPRQFCHFDPGCDGVPGYCAKVQSMCSNVMNTPADPGQTEGVICGCDGTTYRAGSCMGVPWSRRGPC